MIGCEESHGILVTPQIRDKDAAAAALLFAELALDEKRQGRSVLDYLERIFREFGYFHNEVLNMVMTGVEGREKMARMLDGLRTTPLTEIAGLPVTHVEDLRDPEGRLGPIKGATDAAARNVLLFRLGERGRIALRPSGTEPKAKAYIEVCSPPCPTGASAGAGSKPAARFASLRSVSPRTSSRRRWRWRSDALNEPVWAGLTFPMGPISSMPSPDGPRENTGLPHSSSRIEPFHAKIAKLRAHSPHQAVGSR